jgi:hypothetical protein
MKVCHYGVEVFDFSQNKLTTYVEHVRLPVDQDGEKNSNFLGV